MERLASSFHRTSWEYASEWDTVSDVVYLRATTTWYERNTPVTVGFDKGRSAWYTGVLTP